MKPFILPLVGTSVLHYSLDRLPDQDTVDFLCNNHYDLIKPHKRLCKDLSKITYILPETEHLTRFFTEYYSLNNCRTLNNFREIFIYDKPQKNRNEKTLNVVFLSRIAVFKGIFDIIDVINNINSEKRTAGIKLYIYGDLELNKTDEQSFFNSLNDNIVYKGSISNNLVINELSKYDLFVFPTRCLGEGTPGVISEAFLAGVPVLSSDFPQARFLMRNDFDSSLFKMFDLKELKERLIYILLNREYLITITRGAINAGHHFVYENERPFFLKYVCGICDQ